MYYYYFLLKQIHSPILITNYSNLSDLFEFQELFYLFNYQ